jgi:hypothetical protein
MSVELLIIKHFKVNKNKISFSNKIIQIPEDPVFGTPDKSWKQIFF